MRDNWMTRLVGRARGLHPDDLPLARARGRGVWLGRGQAEAAIHRAAALARRTNRPACVVRLYCRGPRSARLVADRLCRRARVTDELGRLDPGPEIARRGGTLLVAILHDTPQAAAVALVNALVAPLAEADRPTVAVEPHGGEEAAADAQPPRVAEIEVLHAAA